MTHYFFWETHINIITADCMQNYSDYYSEEYEIGIRYWTDSFPVFSPLKSSVNCLKTKDKIFASMDDDCPCFPILIITKGFQVSFYLLFNILFCNFDRLNVVEKAILVLICLHRPSSLSVMR